MVFGKTVMNQKHNEIAWSL